MLIIPIIKAWFICAAQMGLCVRGGRAAIRGAAGSSSQVRSVKLSHHSSPSPHPQGRAPPCGFPCCISGALFVHAVLNHGPHLVYCLDKLFANCLTPCYTPLGQGAYLGGTGSGSPLSKGAGAGNSCSREWGRVVSRSQGC